MENDKILNTDNNSEQTKSTEKEIAHITHLPGLYQNWFLEYASYVILERAVPHVYDGLKPVQRRILHSMKRMEDGRYNKVANIIGHTMQFHPHGDASIGDALVQLGQKEILIDMQGNWGNIFTGDNAAAARYIEARLSKFALEVVFNHKTTEWKLSYDGRNNEPVTLPVKFPLLLAQGVEGIAVGLASKIMPHNFNELIDACVDYLRGKEFEIYPDFPTGGFVDVEKYNHGLRGGRIRVRAKIEVEDRKTLVIKDIPYSKNTQSLIDSILAANDKGKIKIKKIDDNTAAEVEIQVHLTPGVSPDKMIDALYAFTDCEVSISPNSCVILDEKPYFIGVNEILKINADQTRKLLKMELEIRLQELEDSWHQSSLEKIFIENRIYIRIENCETYEAIIETIDQGLEPFKPLLRRKVTRDDIINLTEIKIKRISKYDSFKADEYIKGLETEMEIVKRNLLNLTAYTIDYFLNIKKKYGKQYPRRTQIRSFDVIEATAVVVQNEKLYLNSEDGFAGTGLKKDEYICDCSDIDDMIYFRKNGTYMISKVTDKLFVGKDIIHIDIFKKNDDRTIYNAAYQDGESGRTFVKRFAVNGITRDKEYDLTQGTKNSKVLYFSANPNGEAEVVKVTLKPRARVKAATFEYNFSEMEIKGRNTKGNLLSRYPVHHIKLKEEGVSTLAARDLWFENNTCRLNTDKRGTYLGAFEGEDKIVELTRTGQIRITNFDLSNHYAQDICLIEKYNPNKIYSVIYWEADQQYYYLKRFAPEDNTLPQSYVGENPKSKVLEISADTYPRVEIKFGGKEEHRAEQIIDVADFIGVKSHNARGKRLTIYQVKSIKFIEPLVSEQKILQYQQELKQMKPPITPGEQNKMTF